MFGGLLEEILNASALLGIFFSWATFTKKAFNLSMHIIRPPTEEVTCKSVTKVKCEECGKVFSDDEYDEDELVHGKFFV